MPRRYRHMIGLMIGFTTTPTLYADADAEREVLARIVHELQAIESLITQAESTADNDSRVRFQYDWLRQDLDQVQDGIQSHIDAPRAQPRAFPPLRGDYRR
jgi:RAQPRD family integrative conjugative element protein